MGLAQRKFCRIRPVGAIYRAGLFAKADATGHVDRRSIHCNRFFDCGLDPTGQLDAKFKVKLLDR